MKRWFRRVIVRTHLTHLRRERREKRGGRLVAVASFDDPPTDPGTSPSGRAERGESRAILASAFARLSAGDQDLVRWRYVDGLSCREIGERLGVSSEYASRITRAALDRLRADLPSLGDEASS